MAKELQKTLKLENEEYNINAVYSDKAGKVTNQLTVIESTTGDKDNDVSFNFDGSADQTIDYVPADGGKFRGPVHLINPTQNPDSSELITSGQVNNRIAQLRGAPLCTWDANSFQMKPLVDENADQVYLLTTIVGTEEDLQKLNNTFIHDGTSNATSRGLRISSSASSETCQIAGIESSAVYTELDVIIPYRAIFRGYPDQSIIYNKAVNGLTEGAFGPTDAYSNGAPITSVVIPDNIKNISKAAFKKCTALSKVTLFHGVENIGEAAFSGCTALETITIPNTVNSIAKDAFAGCSSLNTVIYGGTESSWNTLINNNVSTGNDYLKNVTTKKYEPGSANNPLDGPYIYICKKEGEDITSSNKMFLKLPGEDRVEISKGAARLESPENAATQGYYTYETLAAIIAGINSRLEALGSDTLALPETFDKTGHVVIPEAIPEDIIDSEKVLVDVSVVPTVQELAEAITKSYGNTSWDADSATQSLNNVIAHLSSESGDSIKALRADLDQLEADVEFELNGGEIGVAVDYANSRIDNLETDLTSEVGAREKLEEGLSNKVNTNVLELKAFDTGGTPIKDKEGNPITVTLNATQLQKLINFIDSIE